MQALAFLKCLGKALARQVGNLAGLAVAGEVVAEIGQEVWDNWKRQRNERERRAELEAMLHMAAQEFRRQVEEVVREVAAGQPAEVCQQISSFMESVPSLLRRRATAIHQAETLPPDMPLRDARDLVALLSRDRPIPWPATQEPTVDAAAVAADTTPQVVLTITHGPSTGKELVLAERSTCIIGRDKDCHLRFPRNKEHQRISRHHCLVEVNLPDVRIRDLDSLNGTWVNGVEIGRRPRGAMPRDQLIAPEHDIKHGDEVRLGRRSGTAIQINVIAPPAAVTEQGGQDGNPVLQAITVSCSRCGRDVTGQPGTNRRGDFICVTCREGPRQVIDHLLERAAAGEPELAALRGYALLEELGQGGMGAVFRARWVTEGRDVAVKVMLPRVAASPQAARRFLQEIANTQRLRHPHVVGLAEAGSWRGVFFMILEYCDGRSVAYLMKQRGGKLPLDEAVEIALQALDGLEYAHNIFGPGKGLVHRDLKPDNIFLSGSGSSRLAKLGDYGLSKAFDDSGLSGATMTGETAGTPHFMCRRQVLAFKEAGPEVDVWALAATLYAMLSGRAPRDFRPDTDPWLVILETDPIPLCQRNAAVPERLAAIIDQALREAPGLHFSSAQALRAALESAL